MAGHRRLTQGREHYARIRAMLYHCLSFIDTYTEPVDSPTERQRFFEAFLDKHPTKKCTKGNGGYVDRGEFYDVNSFKKLLRDHLVLHGAAKHKVPYKETLDYFFQHRGSSMAPKHKTRCRNEYMRLQRTQQSELGSESASVPESTTASPPPADYPKTENSEGWSGRQMVLSPNVVVSKHEPGAAQRVQPSPPDSVLQSDQTLAPHRVRRRNSADSCNVACQHATESAQSARWQQPTNGSSFGHLAFPPLGFERREVEERLQGIEHAFNTISVLLGDRCPCKTRLSSAPSQDLQELYEMALGGAWHQIARFGSDDMPHSAVFLSALAGAAVHRHVFRAVLTPEQQVFPGLTSPLQAEYTSRVLGRRGASLENILGAAELEAIKDDRYMASTIFPCAVNLTRKAADTMTEHLRHQPAFPKDPEACFLVKSRLEEVLVKGFEQALMLKAYIHAVKANIEYDWFVPRTAFEESKMRLSISDAPLESSGSSRKIKMTTLSGLRLISLPGGEEKCVQKPTVTMVSSAN